MEEFKYKPSTPADVSYAPKINTVVLGDSYVTDLPIGINQDLKIFTLRFTNIKPTEATGILSFFKRHGGYKTFKWTDPYGREGLYRVKAWGESIGNAISTITTTFEEVLF